MYVIYRKKVQDKVDEYGTPQIPTFKASSASAYTAIS